MDTPAALATSLIVIFFIFLLVQTVFIIAFFIRTIKN
ncbi:hypothetical protein [Lactococcus petauri]